MSEIAHTVLIVEDDPPIRRFVRSTLESHELAVVEAETGRAGLREIATRQPDLVVLDLGLPDTDGIDVIRELRGWTQVPVIVLSARTSEAVKVEALDAGADDYLTKPFGVSELLARVRAQLRRSVRSQDEAPAVSFGDVAVDLARREVTRAGQPVRLTPTEYRLLTVLMRHAGRVLTHRQLLRDVWGPEQVDNAHYLRVYMGHLRQKLEKDPAQPEHILTETAVGYRLVGIR
ncbi:winged helix family two component transcriptional regulator [Caballeronia novacaledonica]|uniref:Winged helix family two component transcriptional regulator n=1 Tax=Caballeronia novacaledonica TaxID=1544861 RepID=A0A2U3IFF6_9BURK|nr:two-component system response regulator KdpE [Caballeronia novacaledonica]SPB18864.1 winged helix family two component transcriptional regulator [Caballeronia novacaledonica]